MVFRSTANYNPLNELKSYVQVRNGMLAFKNEEAFRTVVDCLHKRINHLPNPWNYHVEKADYVLEQFEKLFIGFQSLRKYVMMKVSGLITINRLTAENNPDDYFFPDKVLRSLVNVNFELAIGVRIICIRDCQKKYLKIKNGEKIYGSYYCDQKYGGNISSLQKSTTNHPELAAKVNVGSGASDFGLIINNISLICDNQNLLSCTFRAWLTYWNTDCQNYGFPLYNWYIYDDAYPAPNLVYTVIDSSVSMHFSFPQTGRYRVCVEAYNSLCKSDLYCEWFTITKNVPPPSTEQSCCKTDQGQYKNPTYAYRRQMRVRLVNMTFQPFLPYSSITAATRAWKKGPLGLVWIPNIVRFIAVQIASPRDAIGTYNTYNENYCNGPLRNMPAYSNNGHTSSVSIFHYSFASIWVHNNGIISDHSIDDAGLLSTASLSLCQP